MRKQEANNCGKDGWKCGRAYALLRKRQTGWGKDAKMQNNEETGIWKMAKATNNTETFEHFMLVISYQPTGPMRLWLFIMNNPQYRAHQTLETPLCLSSRNYCSVLSLFDSRATTATVYLVRNRCWPDPGATLYSMRVRCGLTLAQVLYLRWNRGWNACEMNLRSHTPHTVIP